MIKNTRNTELASEMKATGRTNNGRITIRLKHNLIIDFLRLVLFIPLCVPLKYLASANSP